MSSSVNLLNLSGQIMSRKVKIEVLKEFIYEISIKVLTVCMTSQSILGPEKKYQIISMPSNMMS